jgi:hypothetical protein
MSGISGFLVSCLWLLAFGRWFLARGKKREASGQTDGI